MNHFIKKVGLFFGSFNPIHIGHLIIANTILQKTDLTEIWFVVSPQNPHKQETELLPQAQRLQMVQLAIDGNPSFVASSIEFEMPKPSYTIHTLQYLKKNYPDCQFSLIIGEDNWVKFHTWKNAEEILNNYQLYVYPRFQSSEIHSFEHKNVIFVPCPLLDISSTYIRNLVKERKSIEYLVPEKVLYYINQNGCYLN